MAPAFSARLIARRLIQVVVVLVYFQAGMHGIGALSKLREAHELGTPLDASIPFVPWTIFPYSAAYPFALMPLFLVRCERLWRRTLAACVWTLTISFALYLAWPVTSLGLRAPISAVDMTTLGGWGVWLTYTIDPPYNLFPSLHLSMALLAALIAYEALPSAGRLAMGPVIAIGVSICTTKQHFIADGVAAVVLALGVHAAVVRPYRSEAATPDARTFGWRGVLLHALFVALFFGAFAIANAFRLRS